MKPAKKQVVPIIITGILVVLGGLYLLLNEPVSSEVPARFIEKIATDISETPSIIEHSCTVDSTIIVDSVLHSPYIISIASASPDSIHQEEEYTLFHAGEIFYGIAPSGIMDLHKSYLEHPSADFLNFPNDLKTFADELINFENKPKSLFDSKELKLKRSMYQLSNSLLNLANAQEILICTHSNYTSYQFGNPSTDSTSITHVIFEDSPPIEIVLKAPGLNHPNWNQETIDAIIGSIRIQ